MGEFEGLSYTGFTPRFMSVGLALQDDQQGSHLSKGQYSWKF
jgi:hypothetical protein